MAQPGNQERDPKVPFEDIATLADAALGRSIVAEHRTTLSLWHVAGSDVPAPTGG